MEFSDQELETYFRKELVADNIISLMLRFPELVTLEQLESLRDKRKDTRDYLSKLIRYKRAGLKVK